jgi:hypothetical protein
MRNFYSLSFALLFFCTNSYAKYITVVTTDTAMVYFLQQNAPKISVSENINLVVSFVDDRKITRYFQLGNLGDVLLTSNQNLCYDLSEKGLASGSYSILISSSVYCTSVLNEKKKVFVITSGEYTNFAKERIGIIAQNINASLYFLDKNDNVYEKVAGMIKDNVNVCGLLPLFQSINFETNKLVKTNEDIKYYLCPIIGLNNNAYNILIKNFNETKHN